ncbi:MAG: murein L,D-transpeptidase catalytic domain family protein [Bacteroidota bacterium]
MLLRTKSVLLICFIMMLSVSAFAGTDKLSDVNDPVTNNGDNPFLPADIQQKADAIYDSLKLGEAGLERDIFYKGYKGYTYLLYKNQLDNVNVMTIADFSQSSKNKRLYIIDLAKMQLVFNTFVSHGKNSGGEMATSFSNIKDSYKSTLGFMVTADTYIGGSGYSLRFSGVEPGINDRVRFRDIIVHGSKYVNAEKAEEDGKVGNSLGCPAVPLALSRKIIDCIKGGSMYFIYHPDEYYNASSPILNAMIVPPAQLINTSIVAPGATVPAPATVPEIIPPVLEKKQLR